MAKPIVNAMDQERAARTGQQASYNDPENVKKRSDAAYDAKVAASMVPVPVAGQAPVSGQVPANAQMSKERLLLQGFNSGPTREANVEAAQKAGILPAVAAAYNKTTPYQTGSVPNQQIQFQMDPRTGTITRNVLDSRTGQPYRAALLPGEKGKVSNYSSLPKGSVGIKYPNGSYHVTGPDGTKQVFGSENEAILKLNAPAAPVNAIASVAPVSSVPKAPVSTVPEVATPTPTPTSSVVANDQKSRILNSIVGSAVSSAAVPVGNALAEGLMSHAGSEAQRISALGQKASEMTLKKLGGTVSEVAARTAAESTAARAAAAPALEAAGAASKEAQLALNEYKNASRIKNALGGTVDDAANLALKGVKGGIEAAKAAGAKVVAAGEQFTAAAAKRLSTVAADKLAGAAAEEALKVAAQTTEAAIARGASEIGAKEAATQATEKLIQNLTEKGLSRASLMAAGGKALAKVLPVANAALTSYQLGSAANELAGGAIQSGETFTGLMADQLKPSSVAASEYSREEDQKRYSRALTAKNRLAAAIVNDTATPDQYKAYENIDREIEARKRVAGAFSKSR